MRLKLAAESLGKSELQLSLVTKVRPQERCSGVVAASRSRATLPAAQGRHKVGWRWTVTAGAPSGSWRFAVSCRSGSGRRSGRLRAVVLVPAGPAANGVVAPGTLSVSPGSYVRRPHPQGGKGGPGGNPGYPGYCTFGAWEQAPWLGGAVHGNARDWYASAAANGLPVGDVPVVGAVFVKVSGAFGHVGVVTGIRDATSFTTLEMNGGRLISTARGITTEFGVYRAHVQYTGPAMRFIYRPGTQPRPQPPAPSQPAPPQPAPAPPKKPQPAPQPKHVFHIHNTCRDGACGLRVRHTPSAAGTILGTVYDGDSINIRCQTVGTMVSGGEGSNDVWDRIDFGAGIGYIADLYVDTPGGDTPRPHRHFSPGIPRC